MDCVRTVNKKHLRTVILFGAVFLVVISIVLLQTVCPQILQNRANTALDRADYTTAAVYYSKMNKLCFLNPTQKKKAAAGIKNCKIQNRIVQADLKAKPINKKNAKAARVGDLLSMGKYNDKPIIWQVLSISKNGQSKQLIMISKYALFQQPFDNDGGQDWSDCSLRTYLNSEFYSASFTSSEKKYIVPITCTPYYAFPTSVYYYYTWNTSDYVTIPSQTEAEAYIGRSNLKNKEVYFITEKSDVYLDDWLTRSVYASNLGSDGMAQFGTSDFLPVKPTEKCDIRPMIFIQV
ncbi:MAG: DUF6273 domain-containing protein [Oscillospiraceae bacterium]|nr:MAG: DUF6273 domain-containing protein [Oscillospiraceae bacterium]